MSASLLCTNLAMGVLTKKKSKTVEAVGVMQVAWSGAIIEKSNRWAHPDCSTTPGSKFQSPTTRLKSRGFNCSPMDLRIRAFCSFIPTAVIR